MPVGRMMPFLPHGRSHARRWEDGQANKKMRGLWLQTPRKCFGWIEDQAATRFFAAFVCCLPGGFGSAFFAACALSFAANSCLTFAAMASVSTL